MPEETPYKAIQIYKLYQADRQQLDDLRRYLTSLRGVQATYADVVHWLLKQVDWQPVEKKIKPRKRKQR